MKQKLKGLVAAALTAAAAPEFRPTEVKIARAVIAAVIAYVAVHFGQRA